MIPYTTTRIVKETSGKARDLRLCEQSVPYVTSIGISVNPSRPPNPVIGAYVSSRKAHDSQSLNSEKLTRL